MAGVRRRCRLVLARSASVRDGYLHVTLRGDGRTFALPIRWFPFLRDAPESIQRRPRVVYGGSAIEWARISYALGVEGLSRQRGPLRR